MPTYEQRCQNAECQTKFDILCKYEDRETPRICPECGSAAAYCLSAPLVLQHSYLDGQRSKSDPEWQRLKHASKLRVQRAGASEAEKVRIDAEIARIHGKEPPKPKKRLLDTLLK